jgi:rSAM/selenodomain-associated transferase 2
LKPDCESTPRLSIIVPVLNEAELLPAFLLHLQGWREIAEIIVVDGGSRDGSIDVARSLCDVALSTAAGRARQMNAGAACSRGEYLMFVHCDTFHSVAPEALAAHLDARPAWGFFPLRLSGEAVAFRVIERAINLRSRLTRVATGDQSLFVSRSLWERSGGYADIPLMEDVEFCKRLRKLASSAVLPVPVVTSSRRWETRGILRTVLLMWYLRLRFWLGADPADLAASYRG